MGIFLRTFNILCSFAAGGLASCALSMFWYYRFGESLAGAVGVSILLLYPGLLLSALITYRLGWLPIKTTPIRASLAALPVFLALPSALPLLGWLADSKKPFLDDPLHLAALAGSLAAPAILLTLAVFVFTGRWRTATLHALLASAAATLVATMSIQFTTPVRDLQGFALTLLPIACALLSGATGYGLLRAQS
ncbi:MAG: hypothetical protein ABI823_00540 [Bryobacteraceae bacterium]